VHTDESLVVRRNLSDTKGIADTLRTLGRLLIETQQYADAKRELQESLLKARSVTDKKGAVECLGLLAHSRAISFAESCSTRRSRGNRNDYVSPKAGITPAGTTGI
jgi:hypothetical protein